MSYICCVEYNALAGRRAALNCSRSMSVGRPAGKIFLCLTKYVLIGGPRPRSHVGQEVSCWARSWLSGQRTSGSSTLRERLSLLRCSGGSRFGSERFLPVRPVSSLLVQSEGYSIPVRASCRRPQRGSDSERTKTGPKSTTKLYRAHLNGAGDAGGT